MSKNQLPVPLLRREITWGLRYLLFQLVFLGYILYWLLALLGFQHDSVLLNTVYFVVNLGATLWIFRTYLWQSVKYGISHWVKLLIASAVGFVAYHALYQVLDLVIHRIEPNFFNVNDQGIYGDLEDNFVLTAVGAVALAPLAEELLYRGLVFGALQQRNRLVAYSLSTLVFCFFQHPSWCSASSSISPPDLRLPGLTNTAEVFWRRCSFTPLQMSLLLL